MIHSGNYRKNFVFSIRWIVNSSNCSVKMFKLLLNSIDDINFMDNYTDIFYLACEKGKFEIATLLLEKRPVYLDNIISFWNCTPIQRACQEGKFEIFQFLLEKGAKTDVLTKDYENLLHLAVNGVNIAICRKLLELKHEFINSVDSYRQTPLHIAYQIENSDIINLLLGKGASKDACY